MKPTYKDIVKHYEECLDKHGDNHLGVDWPKLEDVEKRYKVMADIIRINEDQRKQISVLDFGCGTAHLFEYIKKNQLDNIVYAGLDLSQKFIQVAQSKYPENEFYCGDILDKNFKLPEFDYILMNGVFTEKRNLSFDSMWLYFTNMIESIYKITNKGIAFNVMSKNVDWERDDLFHVSLDQLSSFLCSNITRNFIVRNDYKLYEYTVYVFK